MKRMTLLVLPFLLAAIFVFCLAEENEITSVLNTFGILDPIQLQTWGDTAVCFAETDGMKRLILLEKKEGVWQIVIDNPTALLQDEELPQLLLDSDNAVFWTYILSEQAIVRYHSTRNADGIWSPVDQFYSDSGFGEYTHVFSTMWDDAHGGEIIRSFAMYDENENDHGINEMQYLPATWLTDCISLADFDVSRFPTMLGLSGEHFAHENERFFREAAAAIMPEYTFISGMLKDGAMHFLMDRPDGNRAYVICEYASHRQVNRIESRPLPEGTVLGYENFTDSLWMDHRCVTIQLLHNGAAGIEYIYDDAAYPETFLFFGDRTVWNDDGGPIDIILYGDHPWDDITQIDWGTLPHNLEEASAQMNSSRYAMVVNPNSADRLNLRERADRGSRSHGKYYTGTPVTVTAQSGDWTQVEFGDGISRVQGYMMKQYLTFVQSGTMLRLNVASMPKLSPRDEILKVYSEPQIGCYTYHMNVNQNTMKVIGVIGNEWYHVWFPATGEYGYVLQNDLTEGNG